jgi:hypothetical protein
MGDREKRLSRSSEAESPGAADGRGPASLEKYPLWYTATNTKAFPVTGARLHTGKLDGVKRRGRGRRPTTSCRGLLLLLRWCRGGDWGRLLARRRASLGRGEVDVHHEQAGICLCRLVGEKDTHAPPGPKQPTTVFPEAKSRSKELTRWARNQEMMGGIESIMEFDNQRVNLV